MTDYIDREALLKAISKVGGSPLSEWDTVGVVSLVANQPAADVAPVRRGHWIKHGYACGEAEFECSHCHEIEWRANETDYCPNCGAKMEVSNDN